MTVEIGGPYKAIEKYTLEIDGYVVPNVELVKCGDAFDVMVDRRFCITAPESEIKTWGWLLANAMAVSAGYSCHGENSQPMNRYKVKISCIGVDEPTLN